MWRAQFGHGKMNDFQNEHRYHVRHAYGLEGKMADYPPLTCEKLARRKVEPNGAASCPFAAAARRSAGASAVRKVARRGKTRRRAEPIITRRARVRAVRYEIRIRPHQRITRGDRYARSPTRRGAHRARRRRGGTREACRLFFRATHAPNDLPTPWTRRTPKRTPGRVTKRRARTKSRTRRSRFRCVGRRDEPRDRTRERLGTRRSLRRASPRGSSWRTKFPHDYYDRSARVEEETKRFAGGAGGAARRCVALEMEDDTDESDADEGATSWAQGPLARGTLFGGGYIFFDEGGFPRRADARKTTFRSRQWCASSASRCGFVAGVSRLSSNVRDARVPGVATPKGALVALVSSPPCCARSAAAPCAAAQFARARRETGRLARGSRSRAESGRRASPSEVDVTPVPCPFTTRCAARTSLRPRSRTLPPSPNSRSPRRTPRRGAGGAPGRAPDGARGRAGGVAPGDLQQGGDLSLSARTSPAATATRTSRTTRAWIPRRIPRRTMGS